MLITDTENFYKQHFTMEADFTSQLKGLTIFVHVLYQRSNTKNVKLKIVFRLVFCNMLDTFMLCNSNPSTYQRCSPSPCDQNSWVLSSQFTSLETAFYSQIVHCPFIALVERWLWSKYRVSESHQATETLNKPNISSLLQTSSYSRSTAI